MGSFGEELKAVRRALSHKTAKSFHHWLVKAGASFNYSYYMQLEKGDLPSEKVVREIASAVGEDGDRLILAYCRSLFPSCTHLFPEPKAKKPNGAPMPFAPAGQKELTMRQVSVIASSEAHYHLFLLFTLARNAIEAKELDEHFPARIRERAIKDLLGAGLIRASDKGYEALAVEARFPDAFNVQIKDIYAKFDSWDARFGEQFGLETLLNKMMIRRVSGRYLSIIRAQLDVLFELVRSSDETDLRYNEKTLQLSVILREGKIPG